VIRLEPMPVVHYLVERLARLRCLVERLPQPRLQQVEMVHLGWRLQPGPVQPGVLQVPRCKAEGRP
jgi:hypothetical protein